MEGTGLFTAFHWPFSGLPLTFHRPPTDLPLPCTFRWKAPAFPLPFIGLSLAFHCLSTDLPLPFLDAVRAVRQAVHRSPVARGPWQLPRRRARLAAGESSALLLHPPLPSAGVSTVMERERQHNVTVETGRDWSTDTPSPSMLKHLLKVEGEAAQ